jgi:hypothetical protein
MRPGRGRALALCAITIVSVLAAALPARAATPSLLWAGARQVAVRCLVQSRSLDAGLAAFEAALCRETVALAGRGATLPVAMAEAGDPVFVRGDSVVLLVHASLERDGKGRMLAFTIRPHRPSGGDSEVYFGTAPRAVPLAAAAVGPAVTAALRAALAELLPWQAAPAARPL